MRFFAIDTETFLIAPGRLVPRLVCVSWYDGVEGGLMDRENGVAYINNLLQQDDATLVLHNAPFDMAVLIHAGVSLNLVWQAYDKGRIHCTQMFEKLRKIALGWYTVHGITGKRTKYALEDLVDEYLGEKIVGKSGEDVWRYRYHELEGVDVASYPSAAREYAILDAKYTYRVFQKQIKETPELPDFSRQCAYAWALHLTSCWGMRTDKDMIDALEHKLAQKVHATISELKKVGIYRANNTKDTKVLKDRISKAYDGEPPLTAKGSVSTAVATLQESGDPVLESLADISAEQKLLSTYIPLLREGTTKPITPQYNIAETGRTSSYKPNIQNQPRYGGVRECFTAREGTIFVCADYHVAELCGLAQVLLDKYGHSEMAEAIQAGRELHIATAAGILGIDYDECLSRYQAGDKEVKKARQLSKAMNFGLPGGLSAPSFSDFAKNQYGLIIEHHEAKKLKENWLSTYPEMTRYFEDIGQTVNMNGGSFTVEQHRSKRLRGGCGYTNGLNSYFQGIVADGAKSALYAVAKECFTDPNSPLYDSRPVCFVHDEIILETPEHLAQDAAKRLSEVMIEKMSVFLPNIPVKASSHLMRKWYKEAEPVYSDDGHLLPWEPSGSYE